MRKIREMHYNGTTSKAVREYEIKHKELSRIAATEGMVLLKNDKHLLPLSTDTKVALYGSGAAKTIKGGTGSGDVNEREITSIWKGMKDAGYTISNEDWLTAYEKLYYEGKCQWRDELLDKVEKAGVMEFFNVYCSTKFHIPVGEAIKETDADVVFYILSRVAGEGADRFKAEEDYYLSKEEENMLFDVCMSHEQVVLIINTGGLVDLSFVEKQPNINAIIYMSQPGMEAGHALADLISGKVTPSGKLTDSWAFAYEDYPNSETFSHNNGDVNTEKYEEGIYVGYRYFDTFEVPVQYGFGFGLSYTTFDYEVDNVTVNNRKTKKPMVAVSVTITNTGKEYSGKEVVQIYASCPNAEESMGKEYRRLAGFAKTKLLAPGEKETLTISFPLCQVASYDESLPGWVLEEGFYGIWVGTELLNSKVAAMLFMERKAIVTKTKNICPLQEELTELSVADDIRSRRYMEWVEAAEAAAEKVIILHGADIIPETIDYDKKDEFTNEVTEIVNKLTCEQMIHMTIGDPGKGQGSNLGSAGVSVPGSAGETSSCAMEQNVANIVLADGPAGLRLSRSYHVDHGMIAPMPFQSSIEGGFLVKDPAPMPGTEYFQYCTAIPVGTLLAQTWNLPLVEEVGSAIGEEMEEFQITLWLAPGMNIHRNPLCGRNFEYYSEDPLVSGTMAAAMTRGVQSIPGCGTTIKHFACNNQEDNRIGSNTVVSERTLREIYLKGFEIAVKTSQPMAIMSSYNLINGVHAANLYDTCTEATRREWDFAGLIMTDWLTTMNGPDCTASGCMRAGNDLIMPGLQGDFDNMHEELKAGTLTEDDLRLCTSRVVNVVLQSNRYDHAVGYGEQFDDIEDYIQIEENQI